MFAIKRCKSFLINRRLYNLISQKLSFCIVVSVSVLITGVAIIVLVLLFCLYVLVGFNGFFD